MFLRINKLPTLIFLLLVLLLLIIFVGSKFFILNITESIPLGVYQIQKYQEVKKGDYVAFCLNQEQSFFARSGEYVGFGECPNNTSLLMKEVKAEPGDHVEINKNGVFVNGVYLDKSMPLKDDSKGNLLPKSFFNKKLTVNEYLMMSDHSFGYDARYFGVSEKKDILSVIKPILTW